MLAKPEHEQNRLLGNRNGIHAFVVADIDAPRFGRFAIELVKCNALRMNELEVWHMVNEICIHRGDGVCHDEIGIRCQGEQIVIGLAERRDHNFNLVRNGHAGQVFLDPSAIAQNQQFHISLHYFHDSQSMHKHTTHRCNLAAPMRY